MSSGGPTTARASAGSTLRAGQNFGRYHIIRLLGTGGMGAVYQAWDQTLETAVALKVIRPEAIRDPAAAEDLEQRFKRELLLARQVTHKNVVRIHDLGEIDGITYITMPYIHGSDLATTLRRDGRLPVARAVAIAKEVASGLAAAHAAGVVHRDFKPANIMIDDEGTAVIMDFGIARSTSSVTGFTMTAAGVAIGTVEYMAPEQARAQGVDRRADIYSWGLVLNDMLLGRRQGSATGVAELMARMQQPPTSVRSIDLTIPPALDALVTRCLQPDPADRFHDMNDVLAEFELLDAGGHTSVPVGRLDRLLPRPRRWFLAITAAALVFALAGTGWMLRDRLFSGPAPEATAGPTISLAIVPFRNGSGDPTLDWLGNSLGGVLTTELGESARLRTVAPDRLHQVLQDLRISPSAVLRPEELARIADLTSARSVLSGTVTRFGDQIRIDAMLQDLERGETRGMNAMASNESDLPRAITQLATTVREILTRGSPDLLAELKSTGWKPSTSSFEALRLYTEGQQLTRQGNYQEGLKRFEAATRQDANFALAFSQLARTHSTLGYDAEAAQFSRRAISLSDALPPQEKYLISANHYRIVNDTEKAIESYQNLAKASPNNAMVQFALGELYEETGDFNRARQHFSKVVELDPKFVEGLLALGRVEIRRGQPEDSLDDLNGALTLAIQLDNPEARANILQAIGIAYKQMNRLDEALRRYEESLALKRMLGQKRGMAASLTEIAQVHRRTGKPREAEQSLREAQTLQREIGDRSGLAGSLVSLAVLLNSTGRFDDALRILPEALQIRRDTGNQNGEGLILNNIGVIYLAKGQYAEAQTHFDLALQLREKANVPREVAETLHNLAETLVSMGRYNQALSQYHRALDLRRKAGDRPGEAVESYSIGTLFDYQGRYGAAVKSKEEALNTLRDLKQRDMWLGEMLSGYGNSLSLSGRLEDGGKSLEEAMVVARELQNAALIAKTLGFQADRLYYAGQIESANRVAEEASEAAALASDRTLVLAARVRAAIVGAALQPTRRRAQQLASLVPEADRLGLQFLSVSASMQRAEILLKTDTAAALREVERALARSEMLGLRTFLARGHFLRATIRRTTDAGEARRDYATALRLLKEIENEDGNANLLKRADLAAMHAECVRWANAG